MNSSPHLRRTFVLLTAATLAVFGILLVALTLLLRGRLREEVNQREANAIHAVAQMQIAATEARLPKLGLEVTSADVFTAVLESSRLTGVLAVQLFDDAGVLREALPPTGSDIAANAWWPQPLTRAVARFHRRGTIEEALALPLEPGAKPERTPLLEVVVPLERAGSRGSFGAARYWVDGREIAAEFRRLDERLAEQAGLAFAGGALLIALLLTWAYRRLEHAHRQLLAQSEDLARANQELDFAAKTGALGAISAHLIHGLKNPLAGLEGFVAEATAAPDGPHHGEAQQTAIETARRLRTMVNDVVSVLRDESAGTADYPVPLEECVAAVQARAAPAAAAAAVRLIVTARAGRLTGRTANLAGLILANLLTNAVEAAPRSGEVRLEAARDGTNIVFLVLDTGPGLPPPVKASLFRPVTSTKPGGGGMGLAISARLAKHAGGELTLVRSDSTGTTFRLVVPAVT